MPVAINNTIQPKERQFLVYVAGVEIPAEDASVSFGTFRFPEINITVPPSPYLHRLGADDRIPLALFYQDHWAYSKPTYCLMAEGDITGWSYVRSGASRSMQFSAIDPMSILTSLFLFYITDVDTALGNNKTKAQLDDGARTLSLNSLPISFFYKFLQTSGETVKRPIDILLNVIGSVTGFVSGFPVYSKTRELTELVSNAKTSATLTKKVEGPAIYAQAKRVVDKGVASFQVTKQGPTAFSSPGLVYWAAKSQNITLPGTTAQDIYNYCKEKGTITTAVLGAGLPGALMFESDTNDPTKITSVSIVAPGRRAVGVFTQNVQTTKDDVYRSIHQITGNFESRNDPGYVTVDKFGKTGKPAGIAVGLLQHNQRVGTLFEICQAMRAKNQTRFEALLGGEVGTEMFSNKGEFKTYPFYDNPTYWFPRFAALFSEPEFVALQYAFDRKNYYDRALAAAKKAGLNTERGVALLFDFSIQAGPAAMDKVINEAMKKAGGAGADKQKILKMFAGLADRWAAPKDKPWTRRTKILNDSSLSDQTKITGTLSTEETSAGIREVAQDQAWRKTVAYALIPGVDYTKSAPKGSLNPNAETITGTKTVMNKNDQPKARIQQLQDTKKKAVSAILKELYPGVTNYTAAQRTKANREFTKRNPKHAGRVASAKRLKKSEQALKRNIKRAKIAIQFFMRWMAKSKLREHIIACPTIEENSAEGEGIFPVLSAMKRENVAQALVQYSQTTSGRAGSLWDFLRQIYQVCLWELGFITAPTAFRVDENHNIIGRMNSTQVSGGKPAIGSYMSKPNMYFSLPPSCNVFFPSQIESINFQENYATQPTRTYISDNTPAHIYNLAKKNDKHAYLASAKGAYPPECDAALKGGSNKKSNKDVVVFPEELYKGPVTNRHQTPTWFYFLHQKNTPKGKQDQQPAAHTASPKKDEVKPKIIGRNAVYKKKGGGKDIIVPYTDDVESDSTAKLFSQKGYFRGKPVRFNAARVDGKIVHIAVAKGFVKMKAEAAKAGIKLSLAEGYRPMSTQVTKDDGKPESKPAFSLYQSGARVRLRVSTAQKKKAQDWLLENASRYGFFGIDYNTFEMSSSTARDALNQQSRNAAQAAVSLGKGKERFVLATLEPIVYDILFSKKQHRISQQREPQRETYFKYAKFEHFREKYSSRTGMVSGPLQPYVISGIPAYILDDDGVNFHITGVPVSGSHSFSHKGRGQTQLNVAFARTFHEMLELANIERDGYPIGPLDPIDVISDATQRIPEARKFYKKLLYGNEDFGGKDPLGDYQKLLGWARIGAPPDKIVAEPTKTGYNLPKNFNRELEALPEARRLFDDTNAALKYNARPVCTLEEYIDFYEGVRIKSAHPADRINHYGGLDMPFYYQIRKFKTGYFKDPTEEGLSRKEQYERLAALPDFLRDWVGVLLLYRQEIYANKTQR